MSFTLIIFSIAILMVCLFLLILHWSFRAPRNREVKTPKDYGLEYQEVSIPALLNKCLFGWFLSFKSSQSTIIILHGWGGNAEWMLPIAKPFYKAGMNVLLIDSRCHGNSDGASFSSLPRFAEDMGSAINWLKDQYPQQSKKLVLLGHSVGAGAVLLEASRRKDIDAVISISAFAHPEWMMKRFMESFYIPSFLITIILKYVQWLIGLRFSSFAPISTVCQIKSPVLIVHGKADTIVPIDDAYEIMKHCPEPHLILFEVDDAGHESVDKFEEHSDRLLEFLSNSGIIVASKYHNE